MVYGAPSLLSFHDHLVPTLVSWDDKLPFTNQQIETRRCYVIFLRSYSLLAVPFACKFSKAIFPTPPSFPLYFWRDWWPMGEIKMMFVKRTWGKWKEWDKTSKQNVKTEHQTQHGNSRAKAAPSEDRLPECTQIYQLNLKCTEEMRREGGGRHVQKWVEDTSREWGSKSTIGGTDFERLRKGMAGFNSREGKRKGCLENRDSLTHLWGKWEFSLSSEGQKSLAKCEWSSTMW